jgi:hypothetical protein
MRTMGSFRNQEAAVAGSVAEFLAEHTSHGVGRGPGGVRGSTSGGDGDGDGIDEEGGGRSRRAHWDDTKKRLLTLLKGIECAGGNLSDINVECCGWWQVVQWR